jgi:hypothetical protein
MVEIELYGSADSPGPLPSPAVKPGGKMLFPIGIFFMLLVIESIMAAGAAFAYFLYAGAGRITEIEADAGSYSRTLAEALGGAAELGYRAKNYSRLRTLFHKTIEERTIDEAFFILKSGKVIAHSDPLVEEKLKGAVAADNRAYDLELILRPVREKSTEVVLTDYAIASQPVPFDSGQRDLIRQYLYRGIDSSGWLATRAVYGKKKPVGAVGFIISKARIHDFIRKHVDRTLQVLRLALAASFLVSLIVTLAVFARYRSIRKRALAEVRRATPGAGDELYDMTIAAPCADGNDSAIVVNLSDLVEERDYEAVLAAGRPGLSLGRKIKDAVPAEDKE